MTSAWLPRGRASLWAAALLEAISKDCRQLLDQHSTPRSWGGGWSFLPEGDLGVASQHPVRPDLTLFVTRTIRYSLVSDFFHFMFVKLSLNVCS